MNQGNANSSSNHRVLCDYLERKEQAIGVISGRISGPELHAWLSQIERRQGSEVVTSVMEYTAIVNSIRKIEEDQGLGTLGLSLRLKNCRAKGFEDIVGCIPSESGEKCWRLPKRVLRKASRDEVLFYQALYHSPEVHNLWRSIRLIFNEYVPRDMDVVIFVVLALLLFIDPIFMLVLGLVVGYMFASIIEFFIHKYVAHASSRGRDKFKLFGGAGQQMMYFFTEHSVHHGSVYRNYTEMFAPADTSESSAYKEKRIRRRRVEKAVVKKGGYPMLQALRKSEYGLITSSYIRTVMTYVPVSVILTALSHFLARAAGLEAGWIFDAGVFFMSLIWIVNSTVYHRYLHMKRKDALEKASPLMRAYLKSRLTSFVARSHRMHHSNNGRVNQNMTPFADFFSGWVPISILDLADLYSRKTFY